MMMMMMMMMIDKVILLQLQEPQSYGSHRFEFCFYTALDQYVRAN